MVQIGIGRLGAITPQLKVAHLAACFHVAICPHLLMAVHVTLCAAVPKARCVEYILQRESLTGEGVTITDGYAVPSAAPGLGSARDRPAIDRQTVAGSRFIIAA
jgi:L-alanine-DL-glutamate epimerase-like enolase superfamily enzyme